MPDCWFTLRANANPAKAGDQFTVSMVPPLRPGCTFTVAVNGQAVQPGMDVQDFHVAGFGAKGTVTLEALDAAATGIVSFTVECEGRRACGPTTVMYDVPTLDDPLKEAYRSFFAALLFPLFVAALILLALCRLVCLIARLLGFRCNCGAIKTLLDHLYAGWPKWAKELVRPFWW